MAFGPVKLSKIYLKRQAAWGTAETSFAAADLLEVEGEFIPAATAERLQPDVNKQTFAESPIYAGSKAGAEVSFTFTPHGFATFSAAGNPTARNEHQLWEDALGSAQSGGGIALTGGSATSLTSAAAAAVHSGQGVLAPLAAGHRFFFVKSVNVGVSLTTFDAAAAAVEGDAYGTVTAGLAITNLASLPFTMQFEGVAANTGFRLSDGRVSSIALTCNAKAQPTVTVSMTFLDQLAVDGLTAAKQAFPSSHLPPIKGVQSYRDGAEFCFAGFDFTVSQELTEVGCSSATEGVSRLVTANRTVDLVVRELEDDAFENAWRAPGATTAEICLQASVVPGRALAVFMPLPVVNEQEQLSSVDGIWGRETQFRARVYSGDDATASLVDNTEARIAFG